MRGSCQEPGSNATSEAIRLTRFAARAGADGALVVAPYYNRPNQEGLYRHFAAIAECVDLPMILYNIPARTGRNVDPETVERLSQTGADRGGQGSLGLARPGQRAPGANGPDDPLGR